MAVVAKRLELDIGDLVEIHGRRYEVVGDKHGGLTLEAEVTVGVEELRARHGSRAATPSEIERELDLLPADDEG